MQKSIGHILRCLLYEYKLVRNPNEAARNMCRGIGEVAVYTAAACR